VAIAHTSAVIRFTPELITPLAIGAAIAGTALVARYFILKRAASSLVAPDAGIFLAGLGCPTGSPRAS